MSHQDMEMQFADPDWQPASSRTPASSLQAVKQPSTFLGTADAGQKQQRHQPHPHAQVPHKSRRQRWLLGFLTRVALVVVWFTTPLITRAFHGGWILPLLGLLFLPVTTLTYTVVYTLAGGVSGLAWLWIAGALLLDLASNAGQAYKGGGSKQHHSKDTTLQS